MTDLATTFAANSPIIDFSHLVVGQDIDSIMDDWLDSNGMWNGTSTGNADFDYQLLKHNEQVLGEKS